MIRFRQFITEARMAPLYHGTTYSNLKSIMSNGIRPDTTHDVEDLLLTKGNGSYTSKIGKGEIVHTQTGVSLTRSFNYAKEYVDDNDWVVLQLDQQKLSYNYKIIPIHHDFFDRTHNSHNQMEEFVVSGKPIPFKYVTKIIHPGKRDIKTNIEVEVQ